MIFKRFTAVVVILALIVVAWWLFQRGLPIGKKNPEPHKNKASSSSSKRDDLSPKEVISAQLRSSSEEASLDLNKPENWWKAPIQFYGKVVDERDQPVVDAVIDYAVNDESQEGTTKYQKKSDERGFFSITGLRGKYLGVNVLKDGYYQTEGARKGFHYAGDDRPHIPDPNNPVIFQLHKKGEAAELIKGNLKIPLPKDGTPIKVDLLTGQASPNGQLVVQAWSSALNGQVRFDWKLLIRVPSGGLREVRDEFPFMAPEADYFESQSVNMPATLVNWSISVEKQFYISFGNPKRYARISLRTKGNGENVFIDYYTNPDGGRNLEYDASKEVQLRK